jgi:hypothetical protein
VSADFKFRSQISISGSWNRTNASWFRAKGRDQPQLSRSGFLQCSQFGEEDSNLASPDSKSGIRPLDDPRSIPLFTPNKSVLWESNPPVQLGRLAPLPLGQRHVRLFLKTQNTKHQAEGEGVEPSRHCCSTVFKTAAVALRLALPNRMPIEIRSGGAGRSSCERARSSFLPPPTTSTTRRTGRPPQHSSHNQWAGRCSNPRLLVFSQALHRLSYRPRFSSPVPPAKLRRQESNLRQSG